MTTDDLKHFGKTKQTEFTCSGGVHPRRTHGIGVWGNDRVTWSFRVDREVKKRAKPIIEALFGSICCAVESYLVSLIATYESKDLVGVHPANTPKVVIENFILNRSLKTKRKLEVCGGGFGEGWVSAEA